MNTSKVGWLGSAPRGTFAALMTLSLLGLPSPAAAAEVGPSVAAPDEEAAGEEEEEVSEPKTKGPVATPACSKAELCGLSEAELERRYHSISDGGPIAMVISGAILGSIAFPTFLVSGAVSLVCANSLSNVNCAPAEVTAAVSGVSTLVFGGIMIGGIVLLDLNGEERGDLKNELGRRGRTISSLELQLQPVAFGSGLALQGTF